MNWCWLEHQNRYPLSDFLKSFGGNGENKVLLTCDKENIVSKRTIIKNGGLLENEVVDTVRLSKSGIIQRYWILI